jgi:putative transposase
MSRSAWYARPLDWTVRDAELIAALARLVEDRPSRGYWKCRQRLSRTHPQWNHKRIYRVYCAMKLNLRRAAKRRLPKRERVPLYVPRRPDSVWSADFMSDTLLCGRSFRTFNLVDDFNREAIHIEVDTSITSARLVRVFERLQQERGLPQVLRTDNVLNASGHSSNGNGDPGRRANALDVLNSGTAPQPVVFRDRAGKPCLTIVDTRFSASRVIFTVPKTA